MQLEELKFLVKIPFLNMQRIWIKYPLQKMRKNRLQVVRRNWWSWFLIMKNWKMAQVPWYISNFIISMENNLDIN